MSPTPLSCADAFTRLNDYVDRELSAEETAQVERHLEVCTQCAGEFDLERELLAHLRAALRRIRAPRDLMARITAQLPAG